MIAEMSRVGKRGTVVIPVGLRRRFNVAEGSILVAEETTDGILFRPAAVLPVEPYVPERKAEFILSNATDATDYASAVATVKRMGLDPSKIKHMKPSGA